MLGRIAAYVKDFAETENDTTLMCVMRLLIAYHEAKKGELYRAIEREEEKNK
jgi:hypothetical protein